MRFLELCTIIAGLSLCLPGLVSAAPMVEERFEYTQTYLHGADGGTGFAGPWDTGGQDANYQDSAELKPSSEFTGYASAGMSSPSTGLGSNAIRPLASAITARPGAGQTNTVWLGYLYTHHGSQIRDAHQGLRLYENGASINDGAFVGLFSSGSSFGIRLGGSNPSNPAEPSFEVQVDTPFDNTVGGDRDVPFFLLVRFDLYGADDDVRVDAYLNVYRDGEALPVSEPATWDAHAWRTVTQHWTAEFSAIAQLKTPFWYDLTGYTTDEIRLGATMDDVLLIPEPATLTVLAAGGLVLLRRRRGRA